MNTTRQEFDRIARASVAAGVDLETTLAAHKDATDPRGDSACPECDEGEVEPLSFNRFGVTRSVCSARCGWES